MKIPAARRGGFAPIDHRDARVVRELRATLAERSPVSHRLGVLEPGDVFLIDEMLYASNLGRIHYCPHLDTYVVIEQRRDQLRIVDVVARRLPRLDALLDALPPSPHASAELAFTPDRFGVETTPQPDAYGDLHVMVRGPYAPEDNGPFTLPELAQT